MTIQELKTDLKLRAAAIQAYGIRFKQFQREGKPTWEAGWTPECNDVEFRHLHIAYCMARGTPYEKIESKVREGNEPDWKKIDAYRAQIVLKVVQPECTEFSTEVVT